MRYLLFTIAFFPALVFADADFTSSKINPSVSPEDLQKAMIEAEKEYKSALTKEQKTEKRDLKAVVASLIKNRSQKEKTALEQLASQVDELTNRLVVERAKLKSTQSPKNVRVQGATTVFNYKENAVYEISSAVDYVTDIKLKPGERLTTPPTAGDTLRWQVGVMDSGSGENQTTHIILKPTEEDIRTNLIITTDQHIYQLSIRSSETHMPSVSWNYPEDFEAKLKHANYLEKTTEHTIKPENLRFNYEISGSNVSWKPIRVFDDGLKTFIQMPLNWKTREAPVLFILEEDEQPLLVNYRLEGDFYIVDRLFNKAELVVGADKRVKIEFDDGKNFFERIFGI